MFKKFRLALGNYFVAHRFIFKHKLWIYAVVPAIINICLLSSLVFLALSINEQIKPAIENALAQLMPDFDSIRLVTNYFIQFIVDVSLLVGYFFVYKSVVLIVLSPFLAYLSEKVDSLYTGREFPFNAKDLAKDVWRGILLSVRNSCIELFLIFFFLLLGLIIPVLSPLTTICIIIIESYYFGFAMMDYTNERKRLNSKESRQYVQKNKALALGNGLLFYGMFIIPIVGWIIAPIYGIVAGTLTVLQNDSTQAPYHKSID
ncbi:MAG: EI24 domain-containing protein [Flavobacteriales bacterium]